MLWGKLSLSIRDGIGIAASISLDVTGVAATAPGPLDRFVLTLPNGEKFVLIPEGEPEVTTYARDIAGGDPVIEYVYKCVDPLTALDRLPLPNLVFIDEFAGDIIKDTIAAMDATLVTTGVANGNLVPVLDLSKLSKFTDIVADKDVSSGGYIVTLSPSTGNGLAVLANYKELFGASGLRVDKDEEFTLLNWTPTKEPLVPDNEIINWQKVKGRSAGGPDHSVMEFRELDATVSSFKLAAKPFGIQESQLLSVQFENGVINSLFDNAQLPTVVPIRFPTTIEVADITLGHGASEVCAFKGKNDITALSCLISDTSLGAKIDGTSYTQAVPFFTGGAPEDLDHQYYYDWIASFSDGGLEVSAREYYLDALAGEQVLATVTAVNTSTREITVTLSAGVTLSSLPAELRFFTAGDPAEVIWFAKAGKRTSPNLIILDELPETSLVGLEVGPGDGVRLTETSKVIYTGAPPANKYGVPKGWISGTANARMWRAAFGPAIEAILLTDTKYGVTGRTLKVDAGEATRSTDIVVSESGNVGLCTFTTHFPILEGPVKIIFNYDASKQAEYIAQDLISQGIYGIKKGDDIQSELAYTVADCQEIADAIISEFAYPSPQGTITRESTLVPTFPLPPQTAHIDLPVEYNMAVEQVPIGEVSLNFSGFDPLDGDGVLTYSIGLGKLNSVELAERHLLALSHVRASGYFLGTSGGPKITGASWDDVSVCSVTISGGTTIVLAGKPAASTFDPKNYTNGSLRDQPVNIMGTVDGVHILAVEVIYPPNPVDSTTATYKYNAKSNIITYKWARPSGAITYIVEKIAAKEVEADPDIWEKIDEVFSPRYPLPYEPLSKRLRLTSNGLAQKKSAAVVLTATLPPLAAPTPFSLKRVTTNDRCVFRVGAPPNRRAELLRVYTRHVTDGTTLPVDPLDYPLFFDVDDDTKDVEVHEFPVVDKTHRRRIPFDDTKADDAFFVYACWVDRFGYENTFITPFDATRPPMTLGSISTADFFQTATQANGGCEEDDNDDTAKVEFSGKFRVHLGNHNERVNLWMQEAAATADYTTTGAWTTDHVFATHYDVTDADVTNGYCDVPVIQKFRVGKHKKRNYRPIKVVFVGPRIRERIGPVEQQLGKEKLFLIGLDPYVPTPAPVPGSADGYFDAATFHFKPGVNGLDNNTTAIAGLAVTARSNGFKVKWDAVNTVGIRRYFVILSTVDFGTKGPGTDSTIATALDAIVGEGSTTVYNVANTVKDKTVYVVDSGLGPNHRFYNGEDIGGLTITEGATYFVSVIAQTKNGRFNSEFVDPLSSLSDGSDGDSPITQDPSAPNVGHISSNAVFGDVSDMVAELILDLYADAAGAVTFVNSNVETASTMITVGGSTKQRIKSLNVKNSTSTFVPFSFNVPLGASVTWWYNETANGADVNRPAGSYGPFTAGAGSYRFDANLVTANSFTVTQEDARHSLISLNATQPSAGSGKPVLIKQIIIQARKALGTWRTILNDTVLSESATYSISSGAFTVTAEAKHKAGQDMEYRYYIIPAAATSKSDVTVKTGSTTNTSLNEVANPSLEADLPTIIKATIGTAGLTVRVDKPLDARPFLQFVEYEFTNATSGGGVDYLNPDTGGIALLNTAPTGDQGAPHAGTFRGNLRFTSPDLQKRDLNSIFTSGAAQGALQLFARARFVDLNSASALRYGDWSGFTAVQHRKAIDADADTRPGGTTNLVDGGGCYSDATTYPAPNNQSGTVTSEHVGRFMNTTPVAATGIRIRSWINSSGVANYANSPETSTNPNIYWLKNSTGAFHSGKGRAILVYGNSSTAAKSLNIRVYSPIVANEIYWLTFAYAGSTAFDPGIITWGLWDQGAGATLAGSSVAIPGRTASGSAFELIGVKFKPTQSTSGNLWLRAAFSNWATPSRNLYLTNFCLVRGDKPQIFTPGPNEIALDSSSGVNLTSWFGLGGLGMGVSLNSESITTWGVLSTT